MVPILQTAAVPSMPGTCSSDAGCSGTEGAFSAAFDGAADKDSTCAGTDKGASGKTTGTNARMADSDGSEGLPEVLAADAVVAQPIVSGPPLFWIVDQKFLLAAGQDRSVAVEARADVHVSSQTAPSAFAGPVFASAETEKIDDVPAGRPLGAPSGAAETLSELPSPTPRPADPPCPQPVDASTANDGVSGPKLVPIVATVEETALASNLKISPTLAIETTPSSTLPTTGARGHATLSHSAFLAKWGGTTVQLSDQATTYDPGDTIAPDADPDLSALVGADTAIRSVAQKPATNDIVLTIIGQHPGVEETPVSEQVAPTVPLPVDGDLAHQQGNSAPPRAGRGQEQPFSAGPSLMMKDERIGPTVLIDTPCGAPQETAEADLGFNPLMIQPHLVLPLSHGQNAIAQPVSALAAQVVQVLSSGGSGNTDIALSPEELGHVRLSIQPHDSDPTRVVVMMSFERPEVMDLFRRHADQLLADIRAAGYSGADLSFAQSGTGGQQDGKPGTESVRGNVDTSPSPSTPAHDTRVRRPETTSLDLRL